jgi:hypothetical protein
VALRALGSRQVADANDRIAPSGPVGSQQVALHGLAASSPVRCALTALLVTAVLFFPSFFVDAGLLYTGDVLGYYLPALLKTHSLLAAHRLAAIDFSLFNGSSDFYLSPNFFALHPLVVAHGLLVPFQAASLHSAGMLLVFLLAFHVFIASYYALRLLTRFLRFDFELALVAALGFVASAYMINAMTQPPFVFCASVVPWATYRTLLYLEAPTFRRLLLASLPVVFGCLGGYLPLGMACLALSGVLVLLVPLGHGEPKMDLLWAGARALAPYVLGLAIVSPFLYAAYEFHQNTSSAAVPDLYFSAHQLSEQPHTILRTLANHLLVAGPSHEFTPVWGVIAVTAAAVFLFSPSCTGALDAVQWRWLKACAVIYFATLLSIYGDFSVVSDLVFYFVPQVGKMHIYQRFLLPAQLPFAIMFALMLDAVARTKPPVATRIALAVLVCATLAACVVMARSAGLPVDGALPGLPVVEIAPGVEIGEKVVFELALGVLFACSLLVPGRSFVLLGAAALIALPSLDQMYELSQGKGRLREQMPRQPAALDPDEQQRVVAWLQRFKGKEVLKYVDVTPMWSPSGVETFPKVFPYFLLPHGVRLSSYGGFTFYLSANAGYMKRMPVGGNVEVQPDWDYVERSGADFVVADDAAASQGYLDPLRSRLRPQDILHLSSGVLLIPLRGAAATPGRYAFDNGYFRVAPASWPERDLSRGRTATESGGAIGDAQRAVDGNRQGSYDLGSVSHTGQDRFAWLDVDLGASERIDAVRVWNRTDCCSKRLADYWVFISQAPFMAADSPDVLRSRKDVAAFRGASPGRSHTVETPGVQGRHVRIQLAGSQAPENSYLSLAELEVLQYPQPGAGTAANVQVRGFRTDGATFHRLSVSSTQPLAIEYQFWGNPRLSYYLNGAKITPTDAEGIKVIEAPAGEITLEVRYRHWPLYAFWMLYFAYGLALLWAFAGAAVKRRLPPWPVARTPRRP